MPRWGRRRYGYGGGGPAARRRAAAAAQPVASVEQSSPAPIGTYEGTEPEYALEGAFVRCKKNAVWMKRADIEKDFLARMDFTGIIEEMEVKLRGDLPADPYDRLVVLLLERKRREADRKVAASLVREKFQRDLRQQAIRYPSNNKARSLILARAINDCNGNLPGTPSANLPIPLSSGYSPVELDEAMSLTEWESRINLQRSRPNEFSDAAIANGPLSIHFTQESLDAAIVRRDRRLRILFMDPIAKPAAAALSAGLPLPPAAAAALSAASNGSTDITINGLNDAITELSSLYTSCINPYDGDNSKLFMPTSASRARYPLIMQGLSDDAPPQIGVSTIVSKSEFLHRWNAISLGLMDGLASVTIEDEEKAEAAEVASRVPMSMGGVTAAVTADDDDDEPFAASTPLVAVQARRSRYGYNIGPSAPKTDGSDTKQPLNAEDAAAKEKQRNIALWSTSSTPQLGMWRNMVVCGGSVMACLKSNNGVEQHYPAIPESTRTLGDGGDAKTAKKTNGDDGDNGDGEGDDVDEDEDGGSGGGDSSSWGGGKPPWGGGGGKTKPKKAASMMPRGGAPIKEEPFIRDEVDAARGKIMAAKFGGGDLDIFFYGLTPAQANRRLHTLHQHFKTAGRRYVIATCGQYLPRDCSSLIASYAISSMDDEQLLVVRTKNAISFCNAFPFRHVQVILRLYNSPGEVLVGFDVDSCAAAFDGENVHVCSRAIRALNGGYNLIDLSRRSYTYETRLLKYARRGFAVAVPGLRKDDISPKLVNYQFHNLFGLARLIWLDIKYREGMEDDIESKSGPAGAQAVALRQAKRQVEYHGRIFGQDGGAIKSVEPSISKVFNQLAVTTNTPENWERVADTEANQSKSVFEYQSMFLPWGPEWDAKKYHDLLLLKYAATNKDKVDKSRDIRICKCFWSFNLKALLSSTVTIKWRCVYEDGYIAAHMGGSRVDRFTPGPLEWLQVDPGRQMIGSFHPISSKGWTIGVYVGDEAELERRVMSQLNDGPHARWNAYQAAKRAWQQRRGDSITMSKTAIKKKAQDEGWSDRDDEAATPDNNNDDEKKLTTASSSTTSSTAVAAAAMVAAEAAEKKKEEEAVIANDAKDAGVDEKLWRATALPPLTEKKEAAGAPRETWRCQLCLLEYPSTLSFCDICQSRNMEAFEHPLLPFGMVEKRDIAEDLRREQDELKADAEQDRLITAATLARKQEAAAARLAVLEARQAAAAAAVVVAVGGSQKKGSSKKGSKKGSKKMSIPAAAAKPKKSGLKKGSKKASKKKGSEKGQVEHNPNLDYD